MTGSAARAILALLAVVVLTSSAAIPSRWAEIEVVRFDTPRGVLLPRERAVSSITVRNRGTRPRTVWIGYSVRGPSGGWNDVPSHAATLPAGTAIRVAKTWDVPSIAPTGFRRAVMAAWDRRPEAGGAVRLASADRPDAFRVDRVRDPGDALDTARWVRGDHRLGRGRVRPEHVVAANGRVRLRLPAGRCDGAELRTAERRLHGRFTARLRAASAPGSLTAFFLYQDVEGGNDEIDIELLNDGSRRAILSVWRAGEQTHTATVVLPFDPAAGFHDYTVDHRPGELRLEADGRLLARRTTGLPTRPMRVAVNAWWPAWLPCEPAAERWPEVERVTF